MRLDETIKKLDLASAYWKDPFTDEDRRQIAKWLKELKSLRKEVRGLRKDAQHCSTVHGAFFDELAKQGVLV